MTRPAPIVLAALLCVAVPRAAPAQPSPPELGTFIAEYARTHDFNGTVLVQAGGRRLYHGGFGVAERAFGAQADTATAYRVASITKLFTAVLVMQMAQEGRIDLDAPIATYLPDYPGQGADRVTAHQLLNHTSGLAPWDREGSYQEAVENGMERYQAPHTVQALMRRCCGGPLVSEPGTAYAYNNADYIVLGALVERVAGQPFDSVLAARILRPLGMEHTGMTRFDRVVPRLATTYFRAEEGGAALAEMPVYHENWYASGAMYSTTSDLAVFADALFGDGRLLGADALARLLTPGEDEYGYGLWSYAFTREGRRYRVAKRPGSIMGANAVLYRLLDENVSIILLSNTNLTDLDVFAQRIADVLVRT